MFCRLNWTIYCAHSGKEGGNMEETFFSVLADISGFEIVKIIKEEEQ